MSIRYAMGGKGPALLLLHGHPQTHVLWHRVAPQLAQRYRVIAADLRGYGDSSKPLGLPDHSNYSKRSMAADQVALMRSLGHQQFSLVAHDRGARVAHRLAMDHAPCVQRMVLLDIAPTLAAMTGVRPLEAVDGRPLTEALAGAQTGASRRTPRAPGHGR